MDSEDPVDQDAARVAPVDPYAAWRTGSFRFYAASWFLMTFGRHVENVAIGVYVYQQTHNALALGWLGLVQALPVMLLAVPAGQLADRWNRRHVLAASLGLAMLMSLGLRVACYHDAPVGWIYLLLCVNAIGQAVGSPARVSLLPQMVPPSTFSNAVAWSTSVFHVATMTGPALGGYLVATAGGVPLALAVVIGCRLAALAALAGVPSHKPQPSGDSISWTSLLAGIRFVWEQTPILAAITLDLVAVLLGGVTYLLPVFAVEILGFGPSAVGYLRAAEAVGAIFMAVLLAHLPPIRRAGRTMLWAVAGFGAATIVFGLSREFWLSFAAMFMIGALDNISVVVRHTLVQMLTPDAMRGRVSAVNNVFIVASNDLGGLESGLTAWLFTPVLAVVGGGVGTILAVVGAAWKWPQLLALGSLSELKAVGTDQEEQAEQGRR